MTCFNISRRCDRRDRAFIVGKSEPCRAYNVYVLEIFLETQLDIVRARVEFVGVRRLDDENVRASGILVVAKYRLVRLSEVTREKQTVVVTVIGADIKLNKRGAKNVARVEELERLCIYR